MLDYGAETAKSIRYPKALRDKVYTESFGPVREEL